MRANYAFLGFVAFLNIGIFVGYRIGRNGFTDCSVKQELTYYDAARKRQITMWNGKVLGKDMICTEVP